MPRTEVADFFRHIYRELNTDADSMANRHADTWTLEPYLKPASFVRAFFDGSRHEDKTGFGWVVFTSEDPRTDDRNVWSKEATRSVAISAEATITAAELEAASSLVRFLAAYYEGYEAALKEIQRHRSLDYAAVRISKLANMV